MTEKVRDLWWNDDYRQLSTAINSLIDRVDAIENGAKSKAVEDIKAVEEKVATPRRGRSKQS